MKFDEKVLFERLRAAPFGGRLVQSQIDALRAILKAVAKVRPDMSIYWLAYIIATAFHEAGSDMKPKEENLRYSTAERIKAVWPKRFKSLADAALYVKNPKALANFVYGGRMGNNAKNDGWTYRGRGLAQITGKENYARFDIMNNPDKALELDTAAYILVYGMVNGVFSGKALKDFDIVNGFDAEGARRIINGTAQASLVARHYDAILQALDAARKPEKVIVHKARAVEEAEEISATPDNAGLSDSRVLTILGSIGAGGASSLLAALTNPYALAGFALSIVAVVAVLILVKKGKLLK